MIVVKVITGDTEIYLENQINNFLSKANSNKNIDEIIDIKFSTSSAVFEDNIVTTYSALILIRE